MELFLQTLYISASPNQIRVNVTVYLEKSLMSEILDIKLTHCNSGWEELKIIIKKWSQRRFGLLATCYQWNYFGTTGAFSWISEANTLSHWKKVSLWALSWTFSQCHFIHIAQALASNDFLARHVLAESLLWTNTEETSSRNNIIALRSYLPFGFL